MNKLWAWALLAVVTLLLTEPLLAGNKFETIGSGVSGSVALKKADLQIALFCASGMFFVSGVLVLLIPHKNALFLNFATWKKSAIVSLALGSALLSAAVLIS